MSGAGWAGLAGAGQGVSSLGVAMYEDAKIAKLDRLRQQSLDKEFKRTSEFEAGQAAEQRGFQRGLLDTELQAKREMLTEELAAQKDIANIRSDKDAANVLRSVDAEMKALADIIANSLDEKEVAAARQRYEQLIQVKSLFGFPGMPMPPSGDGGSGEIAPEKKSLWDKLFGGGEKATETPATETPATETPTADAGGKASQEPTGLGLLDEKVRNSKGWATFGDTLGTAVDTIGNVFSGATEAGAEAPGKAVAAEVEAFMTELENNGKLSAKSKERLSYITRLRPGLVDDKVKAAAEWLLKQSG